MQICTVPNMTSPDKQMRASLANNGLTGNTKLDSAGHSPQNFMLRECTFSLPHSARQVALPVHGRRQQQAAGGLVQEAREGDNSGYLLQQMRAVLAEGLARTLCMPRETLQLLPICSFQFHVPPY